MEVVFSNYARLNGALNARVLLLNQSYEPLAICNVKKAIILIFLGRAELVKENENKKVRSVSREFPWPSIIRLSFYVKVPFRKIILTRKSILKRDSHKCAYCGRGDLTLTLDHIIPKAKGGEDTWENLVAACLPCNNKKGDRTPEEANLKLKIRPYKPNHITFISNNAGRMEEAWKPFLFQS